MVFESLDIKAIMDEKLENFEIYAIGMKIGDLVWQKAHTWDYFSKDTIGKQIVRSADSLAANISEGFGRFTFKERRRFCLYSRGSATETYTWLTKAKNRRLISEQEYKNITTLIFVFNKKLNTYIRFLNQKIK